MRDSGPISLGDSGITDSQLEGSIRHICANADLDNLTKKGVRKQLEEEYAVSLTARKDTINRIIEAVLAGKQFEIGHVAARLTEDRIDTNEVEDV